jgi:hypothetical protein
MRRVVSFFVCFYVASNPKRVSASCVEQWFVGLDEREVYRAGSDVDWSKASVRLCVFERKCGFAPRKCWDVRLVFFFVCFLFCLSVWLFCRIRFEVPHPKKKEEVAGE